MENIKSVPQHIGSFERPTSCMLSP